MTALVRNGWTIFFYTAFMDIYENLFNEANAIKLANPDFFSSHPKVKLFKRIQELIFNEIPQNPQSEKYLLGNTLGINNRHWRRAKFLNRFRLFFRYHSTSKIIIYIWVNDENNLRQEGSKKDPYKVFEKRLNAGDPPNNWNELIKMAKILEDF